MKIAVIDIGSNSVRLMLWADGKTLYKKVSTTRLGEGIARIPRLSEEAMTRTTAAVADFAREGMEAGATVCAFATAAVRAAENGHEFCARVKTACGVEVEIVSGEEEAELGILGALGEGDGGIIDIGGASTEICYRNGGKTLYSVSLPVGCVRLYDRCTDKLSLLQPEIERVLSGIEVRPVGKTCIIGGTASTLACVKLGLHEYLAEKLQDVPLDIGWMQNAAEHLLGCSLEERKQIAEMDMRRADVIAGGALLLCNIMDKLGLEVVYFSDRDNLEGYLIKRGIR